MDSAYDHIQEESYPQDPKAQASGSGASDDPTPASPTRPQNFNTEIQDAYKAISSSPWAARLGGFLGTVKKQSEQYIDTASKQYATTSVTATTGLNKLISHTRSLSVQASEAAAAAAAAAASTSANTARDATSTTTPIPEEESTDVKTNTDINDPAHPSRPESLPADILKEAEGMLNRFRATASARLQVIEKAEDAADEALLKFGTNISNFFRDAVTVAPPEQGEHGEGSEGKVLFESKDSAGKKVVHATRFDAQLHVIHSAIDSFLKDPVSPEWETWRKAFDVEKKTEAIGQDLEKHAELRVAMEKCVPERVEYGTFWCRYYFLRHVIESEEQRRRDMLKASTPAAEEEVAWDEDSDDEPATPAVTKPAVTATPPKPASTSTVNSPAKPASTPTPSPAKPTTKPPTTTTPTTKPKPNTAEDDSEEEDSDDDDSDEEEEDSDEDSDDDSDNDTPPTATKAPTTAPAATKQKLSLAASKETLKPASKPRRSNDEKSIADSDASYDLVSGATSRGEGSPQDKKKAGATEESDEEDWE